MEGKKKFTISPSIYSPESLPKYSTSNFMQLLLFSEDSVLYIFQNVIPNPHFAGELLTNSVTFINFLLVEV